jgi:two-component system, OmpR family, KDP operon response regulator KdpE
MSETKLRILVVDDEPPIRRFLNIILSANHHQIYEAENGHEALEAMMLHRPDLVILDLGLPDMDGVDVVQALRERSQTPILILPVHNHESQTIAALEAGADDYLIKPFGVAELLPRLRVATRRLPSSRRESIFVSSDLEIDWARRLVRKAGTEVQLTPTEYDLLNILANHSGKVLTHHQLLRELSGESEVDKMHLLRVNISSLRHKLEPEPSRPRYILTEPGIGYRLHEGQR